jgi:hypothetical protein
MVQNQQVWLERCSLTMSAVQHQTAERQLNNELEGIWKVAVAANFRYNPDVCINNKINKIWPYSKLNLNIYGSKISVIWGFPEFNIQMVSWGLVSADCQLHHCPTLISLQQVLGSHKVCKERIPPLVHTPYKWHWEANKIYVFENCMVITSTCYHLQIH